ncbi:hypothetical protein Tco_0620247 [Tanacetum coccineum]
MEHPDDDEDPEEELKEEEELIPKQAHAALDGFAPQWIEAEEEDEEEMEEEKDEDMEVEDNDAEIIHPYEEADPLNRPPPSPETVEQELMNAPVSQSTLQPLPPIRLFIGTFYVGEGSSATVFNPTLCKVYPPGPMGNDLNTLHSRVKTLTKQMWDRFRVESSSFKRLRRNDIRMDSFDDDLTALDSTLREQIQEMKKLIAELNEQFQQIQERDLRAKNEMLRIRLRAVEEKAEYNHMDAEYYKYHFARVSWYYDDLSGWEYRIRNQLPLKRRYIETNNAVRADVASECGGESVDTTAVVKHAFEEKYDEGDDTAVAKDLQPLESCRSPLDL